MLLNNGSQPVPTKEQFRSLARILKKESDIGSCHAYELLARSYGFKTYNSYLAYIKEVYK